MADRGMTPATRDPEVAALGREEAARRRSSPRVRRLAAEQGVALDDIIGTGFGGRVRAEDLAAFVEGRGAAVQAVALAALPVSPSGQPAIARPLISSEPVPAELMVFEIDATAPVRWRAQRAEEFGRRFGADLSELALVVWAATAALNAVPGVNVSWDEQRRAARRADGVSIAVAMATGGAANGDARVGRVLPDADRLSLVGVACAVDDLIRSDGPSHLTPPDGDVAALIVEHGGAPPTLSAAPLLVSPHAARLSTTASERRLVVRTAADGDDCLARRAVLRATLAYDARLIDAVTAARFLQAFRRALGAIGGRSAVVQ